MNKHNILAGAAAAFALVTFAGGINTNYRPALAVASKRAKKNRTNFHLVKRQLRKNAYVYRSNGKRKGRIVLKRNHWLKTYGDPVIFHGRSYYRINKKGQYVRTGNFYALKKKKTVGSKLNQVQLYPTGALYIMMKNGACYTNKGNKMSAAGITAGKNFFVRDQKDIDGQEFLEVAPNVYVKGSDALNTEHPPLN